MRQLELDVWDDPVGGRWSHPPGAVAARLREIAVVDGSGRADARPGFKVMASGLTSISDSQLRQLRRLPGYCAQLVGRASAARTDHDPDQCEGCRLGPGSPTGAAIRHGGIRSADAEVRRVLHRLS